mmetsp:Transcript_105563/g.181999  ORF Transcript_105563/g.181999 Transcript_105563/m.181999 type:complete len:119 (-) Transcript_105563:348-704(-)
MPGGSFVSCVPMSHMADPLPWTIMCRLFVCHLSTATAPNPPPKIHPYNLTLVLFCPHCPFLDLPCPEKATPGRVCSPPPSLPWLLSDGFTIAQHPPSLFEPFTSDCCTQGHQFPSGWG